MSGHRPRPLRPSLRSAAALTTAVAAAAAAIALPGGATPDAPDDPGWIDQWAQRLVGLPSVWPVDQGDPSVVVALVDTGVNELPDISGALVPGWDFIQADGSPQDDYGHGTQAAGLIAARGDNGIGVAGTCWHCSVMPIRVAGARESQPDLIARGIRYAVEHGARIVNVSLSGDPSPELESSVAAAVARGVLVVAAAGNSGDETRHFPAAYPGVLSVTGTDPNDTLYPWATRGGWVKLAAPGCEVILDPAIQTGTLCGSSFTPPLVSGIAALMLTARPELTAEQIADAIRSTAVPVNGIAGGRVDARAALERIGVAVAPPPAPTPTTTEPAPAEPQPEFEPQTLIESGTMRARKQLALNTGDGSIAISFTADRIRTCELSLRTGGAMLIALPEAGRIELQVAIGAGRHVLTVRCDAGRRAYELAVTAPLRVDEG